jgi:hypothetical protein
MTIFYYLNYENILNIHSSNRGFLSIHNIVGIEAFKELMIIFQRLQNNWYLIIQVECRLSRTLPETTLCRRCIVMSPIDFWFTIFSIMPRYRLINRSCLTNFIEFILVMVLINGNKINSKTSYLISCLRNGIVDSRESEAR